MEYKFAPNQNYEDLSSGRVIFNDKGFSNFPVRLASEIFMRCFELIGNPDEKIKIYDPCCGGGYLLTVLGFLHGEKITEIYGSDISFEAIEFSKRNLKLLTTEGLQSRKMQLEQLYKTYEKASHLGALESVAHLSKMMIDDLMTHVFLRDILEDKFEFELPMVDIIITDVPYGNLVSWENGNPEPAGCDPIALMLNHLSQHLKETGVIAIISDKKQKIVQSSLKRVSKIQVGKRKVEFFKKQ